MIFEIPQEILPIIEINGRKYFWNKDKIEIQCAKCLWLHHISAKPDPERRDEVRHIILTYPNDCTCYQKI